MHFKLIYRATFILFLSSSIGAHAQGIAPYTNRAARDVDERVVEEGSKAALLDIIDPYWKSDLIKEERSLRTSLHADTFVKNRFFAKISSLRNLSVNELGEVKIGSTTISALKKEALQENLIKTLNELLENNGKEANDASVSGVLTALQKLMPPADFSQLVTDLHEKKKFKNAGVYDNYTETKKIVDQAVAFRPAKQNDAPEPRPSNHRG